MRRVRCSFFAELLGGFLGDLRLLHVHLQDRYDFVYLQRAELGTGTDSIPSVSIADRLAQEGWASVSGRTTFVRYGIGEFKSDGETVLDEFSAEPGIKNPDTPDLLVCWMFDRDAVEDRNWVVADVRDEDREFRLQTHVWTGEGVARRRPLPVLELSTAIESLVAAGELAEVPVGWAEALPDNYF